MNRLRLITLLLVFLILTLYVATRLSLLLSFPLFFDEAIYIHWAQYVIDSSFWKFISLTDGKQPLLIWLMSISLRIAPDAVIAGRIVSVTAGAFSLLGIYLLTKELFSRRAAYLAVFAYITIPFYLLHDSLALMDGLLLTLSIFACYFTVKIGRTLKYPYAGAAGVTIGLGLLTKSSAAFSLYLLPATLLLLKRPFKKHIAQYGINIAIVICLALALESIMRLSSYYSVIAQKNTVFLYSFAEILKDPLIGLNANVTPISQWLILYVGHFLVLTPVALIFKDRRKEALFLLLYTLIPLASLLVFGKQLYPRYLLFMTFPLLILASYSVCRLHEKFLRRLPLALITILFLFFPAYQSFLLLTTPEKAHLSEIDRWQFLTGEPSGIGLGQAVTYFAGKNDMKLLVLTDKPLGILPDGIAIHFDRNPSVSVFGTDSITKDNLKLYKERTSPDEIYIVQSWQDPPPDVQVEKALEIQRQGEQNKNWRIYRVDQESLK